MTAEANLSGGGKLGVVYLDIKRKRLKPFPAFPHLFQLSNLI
jgi:hypothetical protein